MRRVRGKRLERADGLINSSVPSSRGATFLRMESHHRRVRGGGASSASPSRTAERVTKSHLLPRPAAHVNGRSGRYVYLCLSARIGAASG